jgi:hypothetical protein
MLSGAPIGSQADFVPLFNEQFLNAYKLHDKRIVLTSGEQIEYQNIKLPIAQAIQAKTFNKLQKQTTDLLLAGHSGIKFVPHADLYHYLAFIFYGILYYELWSVKRNQTPQNKFLLDAAYINRYAILQLLLQGIYTKVEVEDFEPESILVFKSHIYNNPQQDFDFKISANTFCMHLRLGELSIIANVLDNGAQKQLFGDYLELFEYQILHPVQINELFAKISYKSYLMNITYEYGLVMPQTPTEALIMSMRIPDEQKETPMFAEWDDQTYAHILANFLQPHGYNFNNLYDAQKGTLTFLEKSDKIPLVLDAQGNEIL